jgi:site-specific DNA recombinase
MLAIYCRISKEKAEGKDRSINDQKMLGIDLAKKLKIDYQVYIDEGVSGTNEISDRPAFSMMLDDISDAKITAVYSYDQSRLERKPEVRFIFNKLLKDYDIKLYDERGEININDESSEFFGDLLSVINQYYVRITKKKIKSVLRRNASEGKAHSSIYPYGYKKDEKGYLVIDEEESLIIKRIFNLSLEGFGTNKIAEIFNNEGILTRYNKIGTGIISTKNKYTGVITKTNKSDIQWAGNTIRNIIKNTIYKGVRNFSGNTYEAPSIIEIDLWDKTNNNLKDNRKNSGKKVDHLYLLKGLLTCAKCKRNYYGRTRVDKKDNYYMCSSKRYKRESCNNRGINIGALEKFIWDRFFATPFLLIKVKEFINDKQNNDNQAIRLKIALLDYNKQLVELTKKKDRAVKFAVDGIINESDIAVQLKSINNTISEVNIKIKNANEENEFIMEGANKMCTVLEKIWADDEFYYKTRLKVMKDHLIKHHLKNDTSFNDKKELILRYIDRIFIDFISDVYLVSIDFTIPIGVATFLIDKKYTYALNLNSSEMFVINNDKEHLMLAKLEMLQKKQIEISSK